MKKISISLASILLLSSCHSADKKVRIYCPQDNLIRVRYADSMYRIGDTVDSEWGSIKTKYYIIVK